MLALQLPARLGAQVGAGASGEGDAARWVLAAWEGEWGGETVTGAWECIEWRGLYGEGWGAEIVPEAFAHPAKYSRALIRRIYQEMRERGWLAEGDTVIDPFGGVALGGLDAMLAGLNWQGCELEPRFVALAQANIDLWNRRYAAQMPHWGTARIAQGDSRKLRSVLVGAAGAITSPPYASSDQDYKSGWARFHNGREPLHANDSQREAQYGATPGQLGAMPEGVVSSPPYADGARQQGNDHHPDRMEGSAHHPARYDVAVSSPPYSEGLGHGGGNAPIPHDTKGTAQAMRDGYGSTPGQLAAMPTGTVSSPPYNLPMSQDHNGKRGGKRGTEPSEAGAFVRYGNTDGQLEGMTPGDLDAVITSPPFLQTSGGGAANRAPAGPIDAGLLKRHSAGNAGVKGYGDSPENLGNLPQGEAVVSSPPFEKAPTGGGNAASKRGEDNYTMTTHLPGNLYQPAEQGVSVGQLANDTGDTFWTAARAIVSETFAVLRPGAHAAWVVKGFVRNRKLVDFPDQWRQLCESVGFVTVAEVRAWVVEDKGTQLAMHGDDKRHVISRKSFFRRLAEKKGSPRIDWETVWLMVKPPIDSPMFARPAGR